jgi:exopolysaccharide biosynthesis polyprenyl glycosylphosphotransferase
MSFSVLISVYEKENPRYLDEALCSIWDQQTMKPGQIVLVKDGPLTEELDACINIWNQKLGDTLTIVELPENVGLGAALNSGLQQCRYELVARMDSDDVSLPNRFVKQAAFMESNPDIAASSAVIEEWDESFTKYIGIRALPLQPEELVKFAKYRCPLSHPAAIYRKSIVLSVGGYPSFRAGEDNVLWSLLLTKGYRLANLSDILLKQRAGMGLMKRRGFRSFRNELKAIKYQHSIAFLNKYEYLRSIFIRFFVRTSPGFIKSFFYKHRHIRKYQFLIACVDISLLVLAVFFSLWIRYLQRPPPAAVFSRLIFHFVPIIAVWIICFYAAGFYSLEIPRMGYKLLTNLSIIAVICTLLSFAYFYLNIDFLRGPRTILLIYSFVVVVLIALWRLSLNKIAKKYTAKINIAFVGINDAVIELLQNKINKNFMNYKVKFLFDENNSQINEYCNVPVIKDKLFFVDEIKKNKVQIVVYTSEKKLSQQVKKMLFELICYHIDFISISDFYEIFMRRIPVDALNEFDFLQNLNLKSRKIYFLLKQAVDIIMALTFFVITLPFWPFILLLIKIESPGPVFLKQDCIGYLGKPFTIIKFRTMKISGNTQEPASLDDLRVTRIGRFLRRTRINEIPQFLNVIRFNMSFIGPRPERPELIQKLETEIPFYRQRLLVKPGISGWDQVSGEYHSPSQEDTYRKLQYDLYYIKNISFFLDVSIFFKTLITIAKKGGI